MADDARAFFSPLDDAAWAAMPPWRPAGRGAVDWLALVRPLDASSSAPAVAPGVRLWPRGAAPDLDAMAALAPRDEAPRAALADHLIVLLLPPQAGLIAGDRVRLDSADFGRDDEWRCTFRIVHTENPNLEPAPAWLSLLLALRPDGEQPRTGLRFEFTASRIAPDAEESALDGLALAPFALRLS